MKNYYDILQIPPSSQEVAIINQYKKQIKKFHLKKDRMKFRDLVESYEVLSNQEQRKAYDQRLQEYKQGLEREKQKQLENKKKTKKGGMGRIFAILRYLLFGSKDNKLRIIGRFKMAVKIIIVSILGIIGCTFVPVIAPICILIMLISMLRYKKKFIGLVNAFVCLILSGVMLGIVINIIGLNDVDEESHEITWEEQYIESEMIFMNIDTEYLTDDMVMNMSKSELGFARNEIFAKHGLVFGRDPYKSYFESKSWYIEDANYNGNTEVFNEFEEYNLYLIMKYEAIN